jgi:2,3-bisphosphoglycerate-dependent phosphoglycerate mutase
MVRHGETAWNAEGRVQGQLDIPLNDVGRAQARATAEALAGHDFTAIYCSDLNRVRQTAEPSAKRLALPVTYMAELRERHYGMFETLTYVEVREKFPEQYARFRDKDPDFDFEGGETLRIFNERSLKAVTGLIERHSGEQILVFTHGGVLEMVYRHARAVGLSSPRDFEIPNAGINWFEVTPEAWSVWAWAEIAHLEAALDDLKE